MPAFFKSLLLLLLVTIGLACPPRAALASQLQSLLRDIGFKRRTKRVQTLPEFLVRARRERAEGPPRRCDLPPHSGAAGHSQAARTP